MSAEREIWKVGLRTLGKNNFVADLPAGAEVLSAGWSQPMGSSQDTFVVWAVVDPARKDATVPSYFHISGTGHPFPEDVLPKDVINRIDVPGNFGRMLYFHAFRRRSAPQ